MFKEIFASASILVAIAALLMGLNGALEPKIMAATSVGALILLYGFAIWPVISKALPRMHTAKYCE